MNHKCLKATLLTEQLLRHNVGYGAIHTMLMELSVLEYPNINMHSVHCRKEFIAAGMVPVHVAQQVEMDMMTINIAMQREIHSSYLDSLGTHISVGNENDGIATEH